MSTDRGGQTSRSPTRSSIAGGHARSCARPLSGSFRRISGPSCLAGGPNEIPRLLDRGGELFRVPGGEHPVRHWHRVREAEHHRGPDPAAYDRVGGGIGLWAEPEPGLISVELGDRGDLHDRQFLLARPDDAITELHPHATAQDER